MAVLGVTGISELTVPLVYPVAKAVADKYQTPVILVPLKFVIKALLLGIPVPASIGPVTHVDFISSLVGVGPILTSCRPVIVLPPGVA